MQISFGIVGATGRFGGEILRAALADPDVRCVGASARPHSPRIGEEIAPGLRLSKDASSYIDECQVLICAAPAAAIEALPKGVPLVIGSTGLTEKDHALLQQLAKSVPLFYAPNFSLGMALLTQSVSRWGKQHTGATIDIVEQHRAGKLDQPSGSAHALARAIGMPQWDKVTTPRREGTLAIHSLRVCEALGEHHVQIHFGDERLEVVHRVSSPRAYAKGVLLALKWLLSQPPGLYSMEDLL